MLEEQMNDSGTGIRTGKPWKFWIQVNTGWWNSNCPFNFFMMFFISGYTAVIIALSVYLTISLANVFASAMLIVGTVKVSS